LHTFPSGIYPQKSNGDLLDKNKIYLSALPIK